MFVMIDGLDHLEYWRIIAGLEGSRNFRVPPGQETVKKPENQPSQPRPFSLSFPPSWSQPISAFWVSLMIPDDPPIAVFLTFLFSSSSLAGGVVFAQTDLSTRLKSPDCFPK